MYWYSLTLTLFFTSMNLTGLPVPQGLQVSGVPYKTGQILTWLEYLWNFCDTNRLKYQSFMTAKKKQAKGNRLTWAAWSVLSSLRAAFCNHWFVWAVPPGRWSFEPGNFLAAKIHSSAGSVQQLCGFAISNYFSKNRILVSALHIPPGFYLMMNS